MIITDIDCFTNFFYYWNNINYIPVAGDSEELSASAITPMINDWDRVFSDITNAIITDPSDADTFILEDENSTTTSVKKMKSIGFFLKL